VNHAIHGPVRGPETYRLALEPQPNGRPMRSRPDRDASPIPCDSLPEPLLHHATAVVTSGQSYRMRQARTRTAGRPTTS
ncbi:MAG: hypothetical protein WCG47_07610, partial [Dermatophilaceae bacterium]